MNEAAGTSPAGGSSPAGVSEIPAAHRGYICPDCDLMLLDGVAYSSCPVCSLKVDRVDARHAVWACPGCERMENADLTDAPQCERCDRKLVRVHDPAERAPRSSWGMRSVRSWIFRRGTLIALYLLLLVPTLLMSGEPGLRWLLIALIAPVVLLPLVVGLGFFGLMRGFVSAVVSLARDPTSRVVHGLEHATVRVLEAADVPVLGGITIGNRFEAYFDAEAKWPEKEKSIRRAFREAEKRVREGEPELARDPRCGTSLLVTLLLLTSISLVAAVAGLLLNLDGRHILIGFALAGLLLLLGAGPLGLLAQRLWTVSTDFEEARLVRVVRRGREGKVLRYEVVVDVDAGPAAR